MVQEVRRFLVFQTPAYDLWRPVKHLLELWHWRRHQAGPMPHALKQRTLRSYVRRSGVTVLIETGTYMGDMVWAMKDRVAEVYSIELDRSLFERARRRFARYPHVHILQGDSAQALPDVLKMIEVPCLFWLDGHYSSGMTAMGARATPVVDELGHILNHRIRDHVVLIDDARNFDGRNDYPTLPQLRDLVALRRPGWVFEVSDDIVRIHPAEVMPAS